MYRIHSKLQFSHAYKLIQLSIEITQHLQNHIFTMHRNLCLQEKKILDGQCCQGRPALSRSRPGHLAATSMQ
jgi:hypothetical protein